MLGLEAVGLAVKILVILFFTSSIPPVDDIDKEVGRLKRKWNKKCHLENFIYRVFFLKGEGGKALRGGREHYNKQKPGL